MHDDIDVARTVIEIVLGAAIVISVLFDVFQSIVTPRPVGGSLRVSRYLVAWLWSVCRWLSYRIANTRRREGLLGSFGPLSVMASLAAWVVLLVVGYGLVLDALRDEVRPPPGGLGTSIYLAGTSLLTIGFGDYVATQPAARFVTLAAGATGLGVFALVVTFLFSLTAAFQRREVAVVALEAGAGAPPSGVTLLETYGLTGVRDDLARVFQRWQDWSAEVLDSHLAYPTLAYFRSSHDNDSWISSLGAIMDAATLVQTTIENGPIGWAKMARWVGGHCIEDLVMYFRLPDEPRVGVELDEFRQARARLERAGWRLRPEDESWEAFQRLRSEYAGRIGALAEYWASPPAQWIGDRSPLKYRVAHPDRQTLTRPNTPENP